MEIKRLKVDSRAQQEGERVDCARFGWPDIFITTRSLRSAAFQIEYERLQARKLREKRQDKTLPAQERRALSDLDREDCHRDALISKCLIDIEGITENGAPLSFPEIVAQLGDPDCGPLVGLCVQAASVVGFPEGDPFEDDAGNSPRPSGGTSGTAAQPDSSQT